MANDERIHFKIALPADLKKRLEHEAVDHRRSLSAEIIARLEHSFDRNPIPSDLSPERMRELEAIIETVVRRVKND